FGFAQLGDPSSTVVVNGAASLARGSVVTAEYFSGLGLKPAQGRFLDAADFQSGAPLAVVISDPFWSEHFGRSPAAVGQTIAVDRHPAVVIGVAPAGFLGLERGFDDAFWAPAAAGNGLLPWGEYQPPSGSIYASRVYWWLEVMVRRRAGTSQARLMAALAPTFNSSSAGEVRPLMKPGDDAPQLRAIAGAQGINSLRDHFGSTLDLLMAGVGLLLVLACVNVAALLLARASARRREIAVRLALGAPRRRLIGQLLTESVLLALAGGGAGLAFVPIASGGLNALLANRYSAPAAAVLDWRIFLFALAVAVVAGAAFGLAPALRSTRLRLTDSMRGGAATADARRMRADKSLAAAQTALSLLLLMGAGLLVRTLMTLEHQTLGFDPSQVVTFGLDARQAGYAPAALPGTYLDLQHKLAALPGVRAVGVSQHTLLGGDAGGDDFRVPASADPTKFRGTGRNGIGPGFFAAMRIPLLRGRDINEQDVRDAANVAVINQALARAYFGAGDPLGQLMLRRDPGNKTTRFTVVGVAGDARYYSLAGKIEPTIYIPYTRLSSLQDVNFAVRADAPLGAVTPEIRQAVRAVNPGLALENIQTQETQDLSTLGSERLLAKLGAAFALLGLLLAAIGIEGTMAYAVVRRTRDIGVRMALGADRGQVAWGIAREALIIAGCGIAVGAAGSLAMGKLIAAQLYGVTARDPWTLGAAAAILLAVAGLAAWLPARRAAAVDPLKALRCD
ncbi:MAG TPA: ADOP family duplicated permease, partial [Terriglobales bacterium]|nr:ADOP family duplicated permease [Terriglobales bacterium]